MPSESEMALPIGLSTCVDARETEDTFVEARGFLQVGDLNGDVSDLAHEGLLRVSVSIGAV